ncbi:MAG: cytochrome c, class I [uncultured bacterium]|nr:MAG: cytochrome c, class I [uncultured bacterium]
MKAQWTGIAAVAVMLMFASQAGAADEAAFKELAKKKGCFNCHGMDKPILGPSLRDIGRKYSGDAGAQDRMAGIIKNGSKGGVWGKDAMPAYAKLGDDDIKTMVQFILSLR